MRRDPGFSGRGQELHILRGCFCFSNFASFNKHWYVPIWVSCGILLTWLLGLTTAQFHPDGHLFAAGGTDGQIKLFDVKTGANAADFKETGPIQALSFSENGTWLAAAVKGSSSVSIWDLRKAAQIKTLDSGGSVAGIRWDYTGQFLASAGPSGLTVQHYSKATKEWSEPLRSAVAGVAVEWGPSAQKLVSVSEEGACTVLEAE